MSCVFAGESAKDNGFVSERVLGLIVVKGRSLGTSQSISSPEFVWECVFCSALSRFVWLLGLARRGVVRRAASLSPRSEEALAGVLLSPRMVPLLKSRPASRVKEPAGFWGSISCPCWRD